MKLEKQFKTLKENWLLALLIVIVIVVTSNIGSIQNSLSRASYDYAESASFKAAGVSPIYYGSDSFAPDVTDRIITKSAYLSTEVEKGTYYDSESKLRNIISSSESILLNENVYKYNSGRKEYLQGSYTLKVDSTKYDSVISQLKEIGTVESFSESANDETGSYVNLQDQLKAEKDRLARYQEMYSEAKDVSDKIELNDRIFNQQRTIQYLEDAVSNIDKRVEYSNVQFSLNEKQSEYANVVLIKFSQLIDSLVKSFNSLINLIFVLLPWAIGVWIISLIYKLFKKRR